MAVFVLDRRGVPLMPCTEKRARLLLARGRARVHRVMPFVIRLTDRTANASTLQPLRLKLDPGSRVTLAETSRRALIPVLLRGVVGGAPIDILRRCIEQQQRPH